MSTVRYAQLKNNSLIVENIIVANEGFNLEGYTLINYDQETTFCQPQMYYNSTSKLFYDDENFTTINGETK